MTTEPSDNSHIMDWLYGVPRLVAYSQQHHPSEAILVQCGAMLSGADTPERRGAMVLTSEHVLFRVSWWTPLNLLVMAVTIGALLMWATGSGLPMAMLSAFGVAWLVRRRPYQVDISLNEATLAIEPMEGVTGAYHRLQLNTGDAAHTITIARALSEATEQILEDLLARQENMPT